MTYITDISRRARPGTNPVGQTPVRFPSSLVLPGLTTTLRASFRRHQVLSILGALCVAAPLAAQTKGSAAAKITPVPANACARLRGHEVASAAGGTLLEEFVAPTNGADSRCRYRIIARGRQLVIMLWIMPPEHFAALRRFQQDVVGPRSGVGDDAVLSFHPDTEQWDLLAHRKGRIVTRVTGPDSAIVRRVAQSALLKF